MRQFARKLKISGKKLAFFCVSAEYLSCFQTDLDKTNTIELEIECTLQIYHISKCHAPFIGCKRGVALSGCGTLSVLCTSLTYLNLLVNLAKLAR